MQVMRLEKLVKLLEDQQDRAQAQRTRLEHRIAQLEVNLREKNKNDRYVTRKYLRKPRASTVNDRLSRALSCESKRALLEASAPHQCFSRYIPLAKSSDLPPRKFHFNNRRRISSDKKEAFICEQCRREDNEKFRGDVIHHVGNRRIRGSLYSWLMDSSALEAFGEPTSRLNKFHGGLSSEEDTDCYYEIVNPIVVRDNAKDCNRELYPCHEQHYCQYRGRLPRRSFHDGSLQQCNPIIRAT